MPYLSNKISGSRRKKINVRPWENIFPPFKIFGNLYFVGNEPASVHIADTGEGLVMLDTGYHHSLYLTLDGIYRLRLEVEFRNK